MGTKLNTVLRLRNGKVKYNGYVYDPNRRNAFDVAELESMQDGDRQIEAECTPAFLAELDYAKTDEGVLTKTLARQVSRATINADYRAKNREQINQTKREWRKANPEQARADSRANYHKHKAGRMDYQRAYRARKRAERLQHEP